jgi:hypothetical protein
VAASAGWTLEFRFGDSDVLNLPIDIKHFRSTLATELRSILDLMTTICAEHCFPLFV